MAVSYKVLAQAKPAAATNTTLYTVPTGAGNYAVISTLHVANVTSDGDSFRVAIRPAGESLEDKHYILYNVSVLPFQSQSYTIGVTLASTDVITIFSESAKLSFNLFGSENS
jgi:hypothetical protein